MYWVYILASARRRLYVGITSDLEKRLLEHRAGLTKGFAHRYNIDRLVLLEEFGDPVTAIAREKQIKGWLRQRKIALVEEKNPQWKDLSEEWK